MTGGFPNRSSYPHPCIPLPHKTRFKFTSESFYRRSTSNCSNSLNLSLSSSLHAHTASLLPASLACPLLFMLWFNLVSARVISRLITLHVSLLLREVEQRRCLCTYLCVLVALIMERVFLFTCVLSRATLLHRSCTPFPMPPSHFPLFSNHVLLLRTRHTLLDRDWL